jgi:CRISPR-associated protein Cmr4
MSANETTQVPYTYTQERFLFMTLEPVHIGTGGYRLGRVDLAIAREPGTNLPKIPGTSLAGVARSYAAMRYGKPAAAGRHEKLKEKEDKEQCPIIYTFGTATDEGGG